MNKILSLMLLFATIFFVSCKTETITEPIEPEKPDDKVINVIGVTIPEKETLHTDEIVSLKAEVTPADATDKSVTWKSSDDGVATVSENGQVTGVKAGKATITVTTTDGNKADACEITVNDDYVPITKISLIKSASVAAGKTIKLTPEITPYYATNRGLEWEARGRNVVSVDAEGVVTGLKAGKTLVDVYTKEGDFWDWCEVTVYNTGSVSGVSLDQDLIYITETLSAQLTATVAPQDAVNKKVTWKSSDETIVTIDEFIGTIGETSVIRGVKAGKATISVTTEDGNKTAECKVIVSKYVADADTGYYYYSDDTFSSEIDRNKTCLGIVCINQWTSDERRRMVISFDEVQLPWGPAGVKTDALNEHDGLANMAAIRTLPGWEKDYPAFKWCDDKVGANDRNWYLPSKGELFGLGDYCSLINEAIAKYDPSAPLLNKPAYWTSTGSADNPQKAITLGSDSEYLIPGDAVKSNTDVYVRAIFFF